MELGPPGPLRKDPQGRLLHEKTEVPDSTSIWMYLHRSRQIETNMEADNRAITAITLGKKTWKWVWEEGGR